MRENKFIKKLYWKCPKCGLKNHPLFQECLCGTKKFEPLTENKNRAIISNIQKGTNHV
jgi:hypothetical protein